jgi:hypothetical protein
VYSIGRRWRSGLARTVSFGAQRMVMRLTGVPVLTLRGAARRGIREIWHLNMGVGDALMLAGAAREYFQKTGIRPLCFVPQANVFRHFDFCWFLHDKRMYVDRKNSYNSWFHLMAAGRGTIRSGRHEFRMRSLDYMKKTFPIGNTFQNLYSGYQKNGHILYWVLSRMGLTGPVDVSPHISLTAEERKFGEFARGKIVVKVGGNEFYKSILPETMARVVEMFRGEYEFLQIGVPADGAIPGANQLFHLDLRQMAAVLANARLFVGSIGGMMHLARAVGCPAVIAISGESEKFDAYPSHEFVFSSTPCRHCIENCLWCDVQKLLPNECPSEKYKCIRGVRPDDIAAAIRKKLSQPREDAAKPDTAVAQGRAADINTALSWWLRCDDFIGNFQPAAGARYKISHAVVQSGFQACPIMVKTAKDDGTSQIEYSCKPVGPSPGGAALPLLEIIRWRALWVEIESDNVFVIELLPLHRNGLFEKIAMNQLKLVAEWHDDERKFKRLCDDLLAHEDGGPTAFANVTETELMQQASGNLAMNFLLWHTEDIARRRDVPDTVIANCKRDIDGYNQRRNNFMERMDTLFAMLASKSKLNPRPHDIRPANTETMGMSIDRMGILALKMHHMKEELERDDATQEHKHACEAKLGILNAQRVDLIGACSVLLKHYMDTDAMPKTYRQFKMYNDPALNPQLRRQ